jgi:twitching motility two-component system response regulator PilG
VIEETSATSKAALPPDDSVHTLRLVAKGLVPSERQLLEGLVRVSQRDTRRRTQRLAMLDDANAQDADVLIIDARDATAMVWARQQAWLGQKAVIWIDAANIPAGHTLARRPVQWPVLPILLARALEHGPGSAMSQRVPPQEATPAPSEAHVPAAASAAQRPARPHILVVDDSSLVRIQLRGLLEQRGFKVMDTESVEAALERLPENTFDCVLMDVLMPGADGYDGCRQVKARFRGGRALPVVMLTSKSSPFDRIRGKMAGCDAYLTKPVDVHELNAVLAQHVRGAPAATPSPARADGQQSRLPAAAYAPFAPTVSSSLS